MCESIYRQVELQDKERQLKALAGRVRVLLQLLTDVYTGVDAYDSLQEYPCDHLRYGSTKGRSKCFGCTLHKRVKQALAAAQPAEPKEAKG